MHKKKKKDGGNLKFIEKTGGTYKHYVYQEIGMIRGYKLTNETNETDGIVINTIKIEINLESKSGQELYRNIANKFEPEKLKSKYVSSANYVYSEYEDDGIIYITIKILTDLGNKKEVAAKRILLKKINKYT